MNCLDLNYQFDDYNDFLEKKRQYEVATNSIVVINSCHKLKGDSEIVNTMVYERLALGCKAGKERPSKSRAYRVSSTYKKQCPFKVSCFIDFSFKNSSALLPINALFEITYTYGFVFRSEFVWSITSLW